MKFNFQRCKKHSFKKPFKFNNLLSAVALLASFIIFSAGLNAAEIEKSKSNNVSNPKSGQQQTTKQNIVILLGAPGSGKGTQAIKLAKELNLPHISTGDILRENIKNNTELGRKVKKFMDAGKLAPDELISKIVFVRIDKPDSAKGYILDGYPRTVSQAKELDQHLGNTHKVVINLNVSDEKLVDRILKRASEKAEKRSDDTPEVAKHRLKVYHEQTEPVIAYYKEKGELITVDGEHAPSDVHQEIMSAYQKQRKD